MSTPRTDSRLLKQVVCAIQIEKGSPVVEIVNADFARDLERENARLLVSHARYEYMRRLNAHQFAELYRRNIAEGIPFDDLIDAALKGE